MPRRSPRQRGPGGADAAAEASAHPHLHLPGDVHRVEQPDLLAVALPGDGLQQGKPPEGHREEEGGKGSHRLGVDAQRAGPGAGRPGVPASAGHRPQEPQALQRGPGQPQPLQAAGPECRRADDPQSQVDHPSGGRWSGHRPLGGCGGWGAAGGRAVHLKLVARSPVGGGRSGGRNMEMASLSWLRRSPRSPPGLTEAQTLGRS